MCVHVCVHVCVRVCVCVSPVGLTEASEGLGVSLETNQHNNGSLTKLALSFTRLFEIFILFPSCFIQIG